jgi:hypothetical protein
MKNCRQLQRKGRITIKESVLVPLMWLLFVGLFFVLATNIETTDSIYKLHALPPLDSTSTWGIFNKDAEAPMYRAGGNAVSKRLIYSPNTHSGVNLVMNKLSATYPDIDLVGVADKAALNDAYYQDLFTTWAAISFDLSASQISTDSFFPDINNTVAYKIRISPLVTQNGFPEDYIDTDVYNDIFSYSDLYWNTGYLTLQNFIRTEITRNYKIPQFENFTVDTFIQRYPKSFIYEDDQGKDYPEARFMFWKWCAPLCLTIALILPVLSLYAQVVREREQKITEILEISGIMAISYWTAYLITVLLLIAIVIGLVIGLMRGFNVFSKYHSDPYGSLMVIYILALSAAAFAFGHVIPRSEFYGLPVFLLSIGISVAGTFVANDFNISIGGKLMLSFLLPPIGVAVGCFTIEDYFYDYQSSYLDYGFRNDSKNLPSLNEVISFLSPDIHSFDLSIIASSAPYR